MNMYSKVYIEVNCRQLTFVMKSHTSYSVVN